LLAALTLKAAVLVNLIMLAASTPMDIELETQMVKMKAELTLMAAVKQMVIMMGGAMVL